MRVEDFQAFFYDRFIKNPHKFVFLLGPFSNLFVQVLYSSYDLGTSPLVALMSL